MQGAFDALDKASVLAGPPKKDAMTFRRLLRRTETVARIRQAFDSLPIQLQARFRTWATEAFDRFYQDIVSNTIPERRRPEGVLVGHDDPGDLRLEGVSIPRRGGLGRRAANPGRVDITGDRGWWYGAVGLAGA